MNTVLVTIYLVGQKNQTIFLKVYNSCIWWHRKAIDISKCSVHYMEFYHG